MFTVKQIIKELSDRKLTVVAKRTGIPYATLWRFYTGKEKKTDYRMLQTLSKYITRKR